ncbi:MAG TPA: hypothetical protein VNY84_03455, partial [Acidimicrobiales bacterium]|nr:hypothetical protein [Acidimicrobiales bacterium]
ISAFHTFAWAEELLSDIGLVAGEGAAADLVSYIRADEAPHVEYLKTVLSEIRDRTVIGANGQRHAGKDLVGRTWDRAVAESLTERRQATLDVTLSEVEYAADGRADRADVLDRFHALGTVRRSSSGAWVDADEVPAS